MDRECRSRCQAPRLPIVISFSPHSPDRPEVGPCHQLALEAKVGYLVTCNLSDDPSKRLPALRIVLPKEFLRILESIRP
jgi:hypothetical protein